MRWKKQINVSSKKLRKIIYIFRDLGNILDTTSGANITLIESVISYGIVAWGEVFDNVLKEIQVCQNKILKVAINKDLRFPNKKLYNNLKVL